MPASVDFRPPSDFPSANLNPSECCNFATGSSSSPFSAVGRDPVLRARPKPRLVKLRRSSKSSSSSAAAAEAAVDSGINPFRSVCSSNVNDASNCFNNVNGKFENVGFVFGVSGSSNRVSDDNNVAAEGANVGVDNVGCRNSGRNDSVENGGLQKEEFSFSENMGESNSNDLKRRTYGVDGVAFTFGATVNDQTGGRNRKSGKNGCEFELSDRMNKLNIENIGKGSNGGVSNTEVSSDGHQGFVFKSGSVNSCTSGGSSVQFNGRNSNGNGGGVDDGKTGGFGSQSIDENVFVFGSSETSAKYGGSSQSSAFPVENGRERVKDVFSSSFSFSSFGAEVGSRRPGACSVPGEGNVDFSSPSMSEPEGSGASFSEFGLPQFDASLSFSANLPSGLGRKPESSLRTRGLRERILKKPKVKLKQSKPTKQQPVQKPLSSGSDAQDQEANEAYSPMEFSPYEETTTTDVPLSSHHAPDTTNVQSGNSSSVYTESCPNMVFMSSFGVTSTDSSAGISTNMSSHNGNVDQFSFNSDLAGRGKEKFAFTASGSAQNHVSSLKRQQRRKYRLKTPSVSGSKSGSRGSSLGSASLLSKMQGQGGNLSNSAVKGKHETKADEEQGCESAFSAAEKACEKWRKRGNDAYEKGDLSKAEDFYTWGVNCIPPDDASGVAFRPLVRCYSNRAAARMALGRVREAIQDCLMAIKLDPTFHRAQIRAANCYLLLGELEEAMQLFGKCMDSVNIVCLDRQVVISASDGIQKSQKVIECTSRSAELVKLRTSDAAASALDCIAEAMSISMYSENLLEMKAEALCILCKHEEAITLCQKTLDFAEKNFTSATPGNLKVSGSCLNVRLWRQRISSKCYFHLGKLEMALDLLEKQEFGDKKKESLDPLAVSIHELLKQKSAGNTAFQSGKHAEAVELYTKAIYSSMDSRPFAAICFCNRAAAHQALGQITDAISDCSLAIALDENYVKAVSRRASLHEMIRDYKQAAADLQKMVSLLERQSQEKSKQSGSGNGKELRLVRQRLSVMEEEAKKEVPLDLYLILGIKRSDPASEIKKAYRKAALRHHPDKAGQSLVRSDVGDEGRIWKDIAELAHKDSDRLFKMIGEAYAVLSDPTKREEYDHAEDMRTALKESNDVRSNSRRHSDNYSSQSYPFERSSNRRYWEDSYRTYSNSQRRW